MGLKLNNMKLSLTFFVLFFYQICICQHQAKIKYIYPDYLQINNKSVRELSKQEAILDKINKSTEKLVFELIFDGNKSVFRVENKLDLDSEPNITSRIANSLPKTFLDFENKTIYNLLKIGSQTFFIREDSKINWQIQDETKSIFGYKCRKAVIVDDIEKNIITEAWFTTEIPLNIGPSEFYGLPGLILSVKNYNSNGEVFSGFEVLDIDLSKQKKIILPNLKSITRQEFEEIIDSSRSRF